MKMEPLGNRNKRDGGVLALSTDNFHPTPEFEFLLELVRLNASRVRKNPACIEKHRQRLQALGETEQRLNELEQWQQSCAFSEREKSALNLSEIISMKTPAEFSLAILKAARCHFNPEETVHLALAVMAVNDWIDLQERSPIHFLVVEDDPRDQELLLSQLRKTQMAENVHFVADAAQALEFFVDECRNSAEWKLIAIFLDLKLPGMSGVELLQHIRAMPGMEDFPVIVMTSSNDPQDLKECQRLNVIRYIEKPVTFSSFLRAVASIFFHMRAAG